MIHAVLSDIHGNVDALDAVLEDLERHRPASVVCLGDFVGYGAAPNECVERLRPRIEAAVTGNHDVVAVGRFKLGSFNSDAATAARWTADQLSPENRDWLAALPYTARWRGNLLVHASPIEPEQWHYVLSIDDAQHELAAFEEPLALIGHSHVPGAFVSQRGRVRYLRDEVVPLAPGARHLVNVGSVGQPRDGDARAAYLLWDDVASTVRHVRLDYDIDKAMTRIRDAGLPRFLAERLRWGE